MIGYPYGFAAFFVLMGLGYIAVARAIGSTRRGDEEKKRPFEKRKIVSWALYWAGAVSIIGGVVLFIEAIVGFV